MEEKIYLAGLHAIGITQKKMHDIFRDNSGFKLFYEKLNQKLLSLHGFSESQISGILKRYNEQDLDGIQGKLQKRQVNIVTIFDDNYPELLKEISHIPFVLYVRGKIDNSPKISVVGSRKISSYGVKVIENMVGDISKYFTIVSGGAAGCDTESHKVCLVHKRKTISIIGTGIDVDYPVGNKKLYDEISESGGAVLSIFPVGEVGNPYNFPVRNELVAGISAGTLVVEAGKKSGTLITANLALDYGKELFAVPGDIFRTNSEGCNKLILDGAAKPCTHSQNILEEFNFSPTENKTNINTLPKFTDDLEKIVYDTLLLESLNIDDLSQKLSFEASVLAFKLSIMEVSGYIKKGFGGKYEVI